MPYEWQPTAAPDQRRLHLWPHRSLPRRGFVLFFAVTAGLTTVPLLAVLGTPVLWVVLPFIVVALGAMWIALQHSYRTGEVIEDLMLSSSRMVLVRHGPRGRRQTWEANPHWVRPVLHPTAGPVPNYLTLSGGPREVELGAFLSEQERLSLRDELIEALRTLR